MSSSLTISFLDMAIWSIIFIFRDLKSIQIYGRVLGPDETAEQSPRKEV